MRFDRYDRIVEHYPAMWPLLVPGYLPILNAMVDVLGARGSSPKYVLDLGCGPGTATVAVAPACDAAGQVTLADGSAAMLQAARQLVQKYVHDAVLGDFTQPDVADRLFRPRIYDLVVASFALHHIADADKQRTLERVADSLVPGGLLLLADEVATDRPAGWDVVERVRARVIGNNLAGGRISPAFWAIETSLPPELHLPFRPARIDDLTSWMARAGLAVSCPVVVFGAALLLGVKPR
jgi:tRNA (cmo5U34)-methyltransferase